VWTRHKAPRLGRSRRRSPPHRAREEEPGDSEVGAPRASQYLLGGPSFATRPKTEGGEQRLVLPKKPRIPRERGPPACHARSWVALGGRSGSSAFTARNCSGRARRPPHGHGVRRSRGLEKQASLRQRGGDPVVADIPDDALR
jgi:hypothetical protein